MEKMLKATIGKPVDHPFKDEFGIFGDIERYACTSMDPCKGLEYIILNAYKLWDQYNQQREIMVKKIVLKVK